MSLRFLAKYIVTGILIAFWMFSFAQEDTVRSRPLLQFSGVIVTGDSLEPVPYAHVINLNIGSGAVSDYFGYFSLVAYRDDTIRFSAVGYKTSYYHVPDTLKGYKYSLIHVMTEDTVMLQPLSVYPWPSKEQFADAFVNTDIPTDDYDRAMRNLQRQKMESLYREEAMAGGANHKFAFNQRLDKLYYAGQAPPNNLLNPFAWAKFIKSWKNGDFKRKGKTESGSYYEGQYEKY